MILLDHRVGIISAYSKKNVGTEELAQACGETTDCLIDVYVSPDCLSAHAMRANTNVTTATITHIDVYPVEYPLSVSTTTDQIQVS